MCYRPRPQPQFQVLGNVEGRTAALRDKQDEFRSAIQKYRERRLHFWLRFGMLAGAVLVAVWWPGVFLCTVPPGISALVAAWCYRGARLELRRAYFALNRENKKIRELTEKVDAASFGLVEELFELYDAMNPTYDLSTEGYNTIRLISLM